MNKENTPKISQESIDEIYRISEECGFSNPVEYVHHLQRVISEQKLENDYQNSDDNICEYQPEVVLETHFGKLVHGDSSYIMSNILKNDSVDLIMTSPPFALVRKKDYGNEDADRYLEWFRKFAGVFCEVLKDSGSLVIDIGGSWKKGRPTRSLYHYELLIMLCREYGFHLVQEYFWWNPAKLPTPAEWVNIRRVRVKDAVNCIWWLAKTPYPKASNRRVLQPYSGSMKNLLTNGYKAKLRPSGHDISNKFQRDNRGSIPPNLIALANTESNSSYQRYCRTNSLKEHPARFPSRIPAYFIRMLTEKNDMVFDPFGGSCVTGSVAEALERQWVCCELDKNYIDGAIGRFESIDDEKELLSSRNDKPYVIFPPTLNLFSEIESPLPEDGGLARPKKV